jgi:hypothetical protein
MENSAQSAQNQGIITGVIDTESADSTKVPYRLPKEEALEQYKLYCASGGLEFYEPGSFKKITVDEFANRIGWARRTLYDWQKATTDFWIDVNKKRHELYSGAQTQIVWRGVFLRAAKGDAKQAEMFLSHYSDYVPPTQKQDVKITGFADLINLSRKRKAELERRQKETIENNILPENIL